ncbi:MAG: hypothetical protein KBG28_05230 [Kofleriaceae bacterium]|jgi:hypothetical protein|nr:hypothetical protein [Kofleriaceae bacterium]MBP6835911.1 hypothetical protein [Kofleriaceae bacterium]MBP9203347.1 hypothetical protein [Kofleriaceae bacterium]
MFLDDLDRRHAGLRAGAVRIADALASWPEPAGAADAEALAGLRTAWLAFLPLIEIAPAWKLRRCPTCDAVGMQAATVCGRCWSKLTPPT